MATVRVIISGRVQGVFFRRWTQSQSKKLHLSGWVKNTSEGDVEAMFQGKKQNILKMLKECREGSRMANVDNIQIKWLKNSQPIEGFEILG